MSAGSSPTGGIGGLFYALLFFTGMILDKDKKRLKNNSKMIVPIILVLTFCIVVALNILVISRYVHF